MIKQPDLLLSCSFCNKSHKQAQKLIAGPNVYICSECVNDFINPSSSIPETEIFSKKCTFCGKTRVKVDKMIEKKGIKVCNECLDVCVEIIAA